MFIGICGAKRSGKNTFAELVQRELKDYITTQASWAGILKISAATALGYKFDSEREYEEWADSFKEKGTVIVGNGKDIHYNLGREFLQLYGTEAHRQIFGDNFWIDAFWAKNDFSGIDFVFITDCRFDNEAQSVKEREGIVVKIVNNKADNSGDGHDSENGISDSIVDIVIENNGSIEELKKKAKDFAERIKNG